MDGPKTFQQFLIGFCGSYIDDVNRVEVIARAAWDAAAAAERKRCELHARHAAAEARDEGHDDWYPNQIATRIREGGS